jgi:dTDP-4-dehydrorhamnose 3,5-epimerase
VQPVLRGLVHPLRRRLAQLNRRVNWLVMEFFLTALPEVRIVVPERFGDARGVFSETWNARALAAAGIHAAFVQDNHALNRRQGTVRGLHYQMPPCAQGKLLRVTRGGVLDVAVDVRRGSPTFGRHVPVLLSAENWRQLWVPPGFAHGYCTLEDDTEVQYKTTGYYSPSHERGIAWNDPALAIDWPFDAANVFVGERDRRLPQLAEQPDLFEYGA